MKHATQEALTAITPLLRSLSAIEVLRERSAGTYYLKSQAFVHFHEDPAGIFADLRTSTEWRRFPVNTEKQRKAFLLAVKFEIAIRVPPKATSLA